MRRLLAPVLAFALFLTGLDASYAQVGFGGMFPGPGTPNGGITGYTGPGDRGLTFGVFWGLYAYTAASRGGNIVNVCNQANTTCVDVATDATTGLPANPSPGGTACTVSGGGNFCTIKTFYDQTGNGFSVTQNTAASRVAWIPPGSCPATLNSTVACAYTTVSTAPLYTSASYTAAQPFSVMWTANRDTGLSNTPSIVNTTGAGVIWGAGWFNANNDALCYAGGALRQTSGVPDGTWYSASCNFNGTSSNFTVNATNVTGNPSGNGIATTLNLFGTSSRFWKGYFLGTGIVNADASTSQLANMNSAARTILGY